VINFDVPNTPEAYTHRIGRTGRSECDGTACTFVTGSDLGWLRATERMIGAPIQRRQVEGFESDQGPQPEPAFRPQLGSSRGWKKGGLQRGNRNATGGSRNRRGR
jgi:ATP-dependent RNA helicase RhlE